MSLHQKNSIGFSDHKWLYKNHLSLVDLDVVSSVGGVGDRFDILSPEGSYSVYAREFRLPLKARFSSDNFT
jgi:hypothetical protein